MTESVVMDIMNTAIFTMIKTAAPILIIALAVGFLISILQATTQVQEQTLTFVPKVLAVFLGLVLFGSYMMHTLLELFNFMFDMIVRLG